MSWINNLNRREIIGELSGKKIGILGGAKSGLSAAILARKARAVPFISEHKTINGGIKKILMREHIQFEENGHSDQLMDKNLIIISPGVPATIPVIQKIREKGIPVIGEIEFAYWFEQGQIVAVTGSQGKTTTTTLIGKIFDQAGKCAFTGGNIGFPYANFSVSTNKESWSILEVSSFQLESIHKFAPKMVVFTNITPNHLDRYENFDAYAKAKINILKNLCSTCLIIYNFDDEVLREYFKKNIHTQPILTFSQNTTDKVNAFIKNKTIYTRIKQKPVKLIDVSDVNLIGKHNLYNIMAAGLVGKALGFNQNDMAQVFKTFSGLEHRLELVDEVAGVKYYNDSKCTTVSALQFSLQSFKEKIVLIAGGVDKGGRFVDLRTILSDHVKTVILIGEAKERILKEWGGAVPILTAETFTMAMQKARDAAEKGDVVLLSPACSSFDMFENFMDRGNKFKEAVKEFREEENA